MNDKDFAAQIAAHASAVFDGAEEVPPNVSEPTIIALAEVIGSVLVAQIEDLQRASAEAETEISMEDLVALLPPALWKAVLAGFLISPLEQTSELAPQRQGTTIHIENVTFSF